MSNPYQVFLKHTSLAIYNYKVWKDIWSNCESEKKAEIYSELSVEDALSITRRLQYNRKVIFRATRPETKEIKKSFISESEWNTLNWIQADLSVAGLAILKKFGNYYGKGSSNDLDKTLETLSEEILMNAIDTNQKNKVNELVVKNKEDLIISDEFFKKYFWLNVPEKTYSDFSEIVMKNKSTDILNVMMNAMEEKRIEYSHNKTNSNSESAFNSLSFKISSIKKASFKPKGSRQKEIKEKRVFQAGYVFLDAIHVLLRRGEFNTEEKSELLNSCLHKAFENYRTDILIDKVLDMAAEAKKNAQIIDYKTYMFSNMSNYEYIYALNSKKSYSKNDFVSLITLTKEPNRLKFLQKAFSSPGLLDTKSELSVYDAYWKATTDFELLKDSAQKQNWNISEEEWMKIILRYSNSWGQQDKISGYLLEIQMRNNLEKELQQRGSLPNQKVRKF